MQTVFRAFADLLDRRLRKNVVTTEDSVRYTFFAALLQESELTPEDVILEYPHPAIARAIIDTYIAWPTGPASAIEFKHHRRIPSMQNAPRPRLAGGLIDDIRRLSEIETFLPVTTYFIYVADHEMGTYLQKPSNGLYEMFMLPEDSSFAVDSNFLSNRSLTLRNAAGPVSATIITKLSRSLAEQHHLRIYQVHPISNHG